MSTESELQSRIKTSKRFQHTDLGSTKFLWNPFLKKNQRTEPADWLTTVFGYTVWLIHINPTWQRETLQNQYLWLIAVQLAVPVLVVSENDNQQIQNHLAIFHDRASAHIIRLVTVEVDFYVYTKATMSNYHSVLTATPLNNIGWFNITKLLWTERTWVLSTWQPLILTRSTHTSWSHDMMAFPGRIIPMVKETHAHLHAERPPPI